MKYEEDGECDRMFEICQREVKDIGKVGDVVKYEENMEQMC